MTRHRRLGGVHDGFYSALFHRPAAGGSSLFEDIVGILREAAGDAEVPNLCQPSGSYTLRRHTSGCGAIRTWEPLARSIP